MELPLGHNTDANLRSRDNRTKNELGQLITIVLIDNYSMHTESTTALANSDSERWNKNRAAATGLLSCT